MAGKQIMSVVTPLKAKRIAKSEGRVWEFSKFSESNNFPSVLATKWIVGEKREGKRF